MRFSAENERKIHIKLLRVTSCLARSTCLSLALFSYPSVFLSLPLSMCFSLLLSFSNLSLSLLCVGFLAKQSYAAAIACHAAGVEKEGERCGEEGGGKPVTIRRRRQMSQQALETEIELRLHSNCTSVQVYGLVALDREMKMNTTRGGISG